MGLFNYVSVIPKCIPEKLKDLLLTFKDYDTSPAQVGYLQNQKNNFHYRITDWVSLPSEVVSNLQGSINNLYNSNLIKTYKQAIKHIEPPQFLLYNTGGKYDIHNDAEDFVDGKIIRVCERDITLLIYLNDDYEGGELVFPDWGVTFKPKSETLIAFPSYIDFSHRVLPVTKGRRFNLVSWICTEERIYPRPY